MLTAESHLLRGESAVEPPGRVTGGRVQLADGRTVAADKDLVRLWKVLLSSGLAHRRAQLVVDSEYVSAQTAAVMLGVSRPTVYKWQDIATVGMRLSAMASHRVQVAGQRPTRAGAGRQSPPRSTP